MEEEAQEAETAELDVTPEAGGEVAPEAGGDKEKSRDARPLPQEIGGYSSHSRLPQTPINCPVMLRAASCARKNAASATSSQEMSVRVEMKLT